MVVELDPIAYKKLSLIKQMYQRATTLSNKKHSIIDKIIAFICRTQLRTNEYIKDTTWTM